MANLQSLTVSGSLSVSGVFQLPDLRTDKYIPPLDTPNNMYWSVGGRSHAASLRFNQTGSWAPVWSAGVNTTQFGQCSMASGTTNATLYIPGCTPSGVCLCTEQFDGTSWSTANSHLGNRYYGGMTGTQDNTLFMGWCACDNTACVNTDTERYDGLTWYCSGNTNYVHRCHDVVGQGDSALVFGACCCDVPGATCGFCRTETYDGATWTTQANMNCARKRAKGAGTENAAVVTGGCCVALCANCCCYCSSPGLERAFQCDTEEWDGTAWTKTAFTAYGLDCGFGMSGTANDAWAYGGCCCNTMHYDGIGWNLSTNNPTNTGFHATAGDANGLLQLGGVTHKCEVYKMELPLLEVPENICSAVWRAGPAMQCCYQEEGLSLGVGVNAASYVGGCCCRFSNNYNGIQWNLGGYNAYLSSATCSRYGVGWGRSDGAYMTRGLCGANTLVYFDGISQSRIRTYNCLSGSLMGGTALGDIDEALIVGDACFGTGGCSVEMNYTSFSTCAAYTNKHCYATGIGTVDGAYVIGGTGSAGIPTTCTEYYDGTVWSGGPNTNFGKYLAGSTGTVNAGIALGGLCTCFCSEYFDGTSWYTDTQTLYRKDRKPGMVGEDACSFTFGGNECGCTCADYRVGFDNCNYHWCCEQEGCQKGYICMGLGAWATGPNMPSAMYCPNGAGHKYALRVWEGGRCCANQEYNGVSWSQNDISPCCALFGGFNGGSPYDTITIPGNTPTSPAGTTHTLLHDGLSFYTCGGNHTTRCSAGSGNSTVAVQYPGERCCCRAACWGNGSWRWCHILYPAPTDCCHSESSVFGGNYYAGFHIGCGGQAWCIRGGYSALPNLGQPVIWGAGIGDGKHEMAWFRNCCLCAYDGISSWNTGITPGCRRGSAGGGRYIEEAWSAGGPYNGGDTYRYRECNCIIFSRSGSADTKFVCCQSDLIPSIGNENVFLDPCRNNY